jgi:hypothetical protein
MVAGSLAARAASYVCVPPPGGETGSETAEHLQRGSQGVHWSLVLGVIAALVLVSAVVHTAAVLRGRRGRTVSAWTFFWLPPLAFVGQEIAERALHAEAGLGAAAVAHLGLGLALQLPFALLALLLAFVVLAAGERLSRALRETAPLLRAVEPLVRVPCGHAGRRPRTLLALGHPQRGPPISS